MSRALGLRRTDAAVLARRGLVALTVVGILAAAFELAAERHWNGIAQLIPWMALAVLAVAVALLLLPRGRGIPPARLLAALVLAASAYGVFDHVLANHESGALDQRYAASWDTLPASEQWWLAVTKTVGPAPTLAPGVLGQAALLLLLASVGLRGREKLAG